MAAPTTTPVDRESPFGHEELFFSTTDRKGIIGTGNRVFARVAGYDPHELVGKPHNIIRHPDMPRAAFRLLWTYLEAGKPIAAYVKNMAADGSYYWVLATVVPCGDGYLSVRMKPSSPYFDAVRGIYASLLAVERDADERGLARKEGIELSVEALGELLQAAGFADYDDFMHAAVSAELRSRGTRLEQARSRAAAPARPRAVPRTAGAAPAGLHELLRACTQLQEFLDGRFARLDEYVELNENLAGKSSFVLDLADGIRLASLNAIVASARLADGGAALGVVADIMRARSHETARLIRDLTDEIAGAVGVLRDLGFAIGLAHLQNEMALVFLGELLEGGKAVEEGAAGGVEALAGCMAHSVEGVLVALSALEHRLNGVAAHVDGLRESLKVLNALQTSGRIEASRLGDATTFHQLFVAVRTQIGEAERQMHDFAQLGGESGAVSERDQARLRAELHLIATQSCTLRALAA